LQRVADDERQLAADTFRAAIEHGDPRRPFIRRQA
jgi:hypothetical protein